MHLSIVDTYCLIGASLFLTLFFLFYGVELGVISLPAVILVCFETGIVDFPRTTASAF